MSHVCHARDCEVEVPPSMLMCAYHWYMVPRPIRAEVWTAYRRGQEIDKEPSAEYLIAARKAVEAVAASVGPDETAIG